MNAATAAHSSGVVRLGRIQGPHGVTDRGAGEIVGVLLVVLARIRRVLEDLGEEERGFLAVRADEERNRHGILFHQFDRRRGEHGTARPRRDVEWAGGFHQILDGRQPEAASRVRSL